MSLRANIDHLAAAQGIVAVYVNAAGSTDYRGDDTWRTVLDGSLDLLRLTGERTIRIVVGKHTVVVQSEGEETVAVVLPTGHAIAKSLRRMIRRMSKKNRGPLRDVSRPVAAHTHAPAAAVTSPGAWGN